MAEADINSEAQSESMPVLKSERIYDFKDYTVVITGFACAAWCFITGGTLALYVGVQTALVASIAGNIIAVLLMSLATQVILASMASMPIRLSEVCLAEGGQRYF